MSVFPIRIFAVIDHTITDMGWFDKGEAIECAAVVGPLVLGYDAGDVYLHSEELCERVSFDDICEEAAEEAVSL